MGSRQMGSDPIYHDALGAAHRRAAAGARIACLVPSITELVCALGLGPQLVARTGFCVHPRDEVERVPKVGGTKDLNFERLRALAPTHVILNIDENRKPDGARVAEFVPHLVVTHPITPRDNLALYRLIGGIFGRVSQAEDLCGRFEVALAAVESACRALAPRRVLYLIWKDPWMTVSRDTYIARTLALAGWHVAHAESTARYPEIDLDGAVREADLLLLSTEPFCFTERHAAELRARYPGKQVALIDGEMTSWYGPRAITGLGYLPELRHQLDAAV